MNSSTSGFRTYARKSIPAAMHVRDKQTGFVSTCPISMFNFPTNSAISVKLASTAKPTRYDCSSSSASAMRRVVLGSTDNYGQLIMDDVTMDFSQDDAVNEGNRMETEPSKYQPSKVFPRKVQPSKVRHRKVEPSKVRHRKVQQSTAAMQISHSTSEVTLRQCWVDLKRVKIPPSMSAADLKSEVDSDPGVDDPTPKKKRRRQKIPPSMLAADVDSDVDSDVDIDVDSDQDEDDPTPKKKNRRQKRAPQTPRGIREQFGKPFKVSNNVLCYPHESITY